MRNRTLTLGQKFSDYENEIIPKKALHPMTFVMKMMDVVANCANKNVRMRYS